MLRVWHGIYVILWKERGGYWSGYYIAKETHPTAPQFSMAEESACSGSWRQLCFSTCNTALSTQVLARFLLMGSDGRLTLTTVVVETE